jgi:hypothetical protein
VPLALCAIVVPFDAPWQAAHAVFAALMLPLEALASAPRRPWQQHAPPGWAVAVALVGVACSSRRAACPRVRWEPSRSCRCSACDR